jgi:hypothetical protein
MDRGSANRASYRLALLVGLSLPGLSIAQGFGFDGQGQGAAMLTQPMTCYLDSATLYGAYAIEDRGYRELRFQLREDGILLVNGHEVKPQQVEINGTSSSATVDVGSIVVEPNEAAMLRLLPAYQKRQFQRMAMQRGLVMTGGVLRYIQISFSDSTVAFTSLKDAEEVDSVSDRCH